jgi:hypothetical protein
MNQVDSDNERMQKDEYNNLYPVDADSQHKPKEWLIATYYNFSPVRDLDNELLGPFFSPFACQTCGDTDAGDRYFCTATIGKLHTDPREKLEICRDCYLYFFS